jgi:hypothetical protein
MSWNVVRLDEDGAPWFPRREPRRKICFVGFLRGKPPEDAPISCVVTNISRSGAKVLANSSTEPGFVRTHEIPRLEVLLPITFVWTRNGYLGVSFERPSREPNCGLAR